MGEGLGQVLLAEGELADGPDLGILAGSVNFFTTMQRVVGDTHRLEVLLQLSLESTGLEGDDLGRGIGVVGDGGAALGAEETVDNLSGGALGAGVGLDGAVDGELVLENDSDKGWCVRLAESSQKRKSDKRQNQGESLN